MQDPHYSTPLSISEVDNNGGLARTQSGPEESRILGLVRLLLANRIRILGFLGSVRLHVRFFVTSTIPS
jgi:hypothetical protein